MTAETTTAPLGLDDALYFLRGYGFSLSPHGARYHSKGPRTMPVQDIFTPRQLLVLASEMMGEGREITRRYCR